MRTMSCDLRRFDDTVMIYALHPDQKPTDEDWDVYVRNAAECMKLTQDGRVLAVTVTDGGGPNPSHRKRLVEVVTKGVQVHGVVLSNSRIVRGMVTALSWFIPGVKFFTPSDIRSVPGHFSIDTGMLNVIWDDLVRLQRDVAPVQTLRVIGDALGKQL